METSQRLDPKLVYLIPELLIATLDIVLPPEVIAYFIFYNHDDNNNNYEDYNCSKLSF